jgi:hypothetical protein
MSFDVVSWRPMRIEYECDMIARTLWVTEASVMHLHAIRYSVNKSDQALGEL